MERGLLREIEGHKIPTRFPVSLSSFHVQIFKFDLVRWSNFFDSCLGEI
jgi:hypothetical protein